MKKFSTLLTIGLSVAIMSACKKDDIIADGQQFAPACLISTSSLPDTTWFHSTGTLGDLRFNSNGDYFENATLEGNWNVINNCDSIYVTRPSNNFYYHIIRLNDDTLKLVNAALGELTYTLD